MSIQAPPTLALAGATGFVGSAIRRNLADRYHMVGLTRSAARARRGDSIPTDWRHCDLFSIHDLVEALQGVDYAVYLVHSMLPSARLTQADFADLDLILADNFARACERCGVRQIVYLGGIVPEGDGDLSPHLESRLEVERALAAGRTPATALRAAMVVGPGSGSLRILVELVRRLPMMVLPSWTEARTQPIAIADVVAAVDRVLGDPAYHGGSYDIGGPEILTYRQMIERTAHELDRERPAVGVPFLSPKLSKLWVTTVTGAPRALVGPLVESLRHDMVVQDNPLQRRLWSGLASFDEALRASVDEEGRPLPNPRDALREEDERAIHRARRVRSVQRLPLPPGHDASWVRREYAHWLPGFVWPLLGCEVEDERVYRFYVRGLRILLLELTHVREESTEDRQILHVTGGRLAKCEAGGRPGRFELRETRDGRCVLAAIHDFAPALPWWLYRFTQAKFHLWVMLGFGRHLDRIARREPDRPIPPLPRAGAPGRVDRSSERRARASRRRVSRDDHERNRSERDRPAPRENERRGRPR